ncbi:MAG: hypothetical protein QM323_04260, partial [Acidobacteriota bacterium]|nr:hypothetical protein [Acidobacteriota bacterium]
MTPLFAIHQEMFFVILTALFLAAVVADLRHSQFFRSWRNMPSPWKALSKGMKRFFLILTASLAWTQNKINMSRATPEGDSRPGAALQSMVDGRACSQPGDEAGIPYALRTGNPPYASNAVLTPQQFESGFACVAVAAIQPSALAAPSNAVTFTDWPYAVARRAALLPPGLLPGGFTVGGRPVTDLYMAASGMISFDGPKSSPTPATDGIPDGSAQNYMAVLQTPSDIVPPGGVFWYAPGADSSLFTWKDVFLGQDTNCLATVQAELFADGGFTFRYSLPSAAESYAAVTNPVLIGAQNNSGGETVLFTNSLAAVHSSLLPAFELRWKSLAGLDPDAPDYDSDELSDADELFIHHTDPRNPDTDGDGLLDGEEALRYGTDPLKPDTFGDGTNDFWRVFAPSSLTDSPWMDGGEGLSLLTLETRLEGAAGGLAALRIGDVIVPVPPGTARVCRVAFPCNAAVPFALVFAPGSEAASASVTALDSEGPVVFGDPGDVFTLPFAPGAGGLQMTAAPAPPRNNTGILCGVKYGFNPSHLCPHTGHDSLKISPMGGYPKNSGITGIGFVTAAGALTNELRVTEGQAEALAQAQGKTSPGPHTVNYPAVVGVLAVSGRKILKPTATNSVPVHHCVFTSGGGEDPPPEGACPCCTNQVCPCRCPSPGVCECAACRDPYAVNAPTNSAGQPLATQNRPRRLLLTGGAPDTVSAGPQSADGSSANGRCVYCQCRQFTPPPGDLPARAWRVTGGLAVSPPSLATNGVFTVAGVSPSVTDGADVFTWKAGPVYSRGRYTVAGLSAAFPHAVPDAAPRLQLGHTNALLVTTRIPADNAGTLRFSGYAPGAAVSVSNRVTGQYDPLQPSYAAAAWRGSYLSPSQTAELRCVAAAAGQHGFTVTHELADASPPSVSRTLAFEAIRIQSEPVTSETVSSTGIVYNPSGIPLGADGRFKVAVAEGSVPGADITWTVKEGAGRVSFVDDDGTGPDIAI